MDINEVSVGRGRQKAEIRTNCGSKRYMNELSARVRKLKYAPPAGQKET